ncbi:VOC family protein [Streptomyces sp. NPDC048507]|uniref:VOC family protein n=1 Tax=Streptomyces sp. NPDC048507 TaxID=3365560 RepID=UPI003711750F
MLGTDFRTGSPNWLDLGSPDTRAAAAFYGGVFGWEFTPAGPEGGGYGFFRTGGGTVAALGPLTEEGAASAWMVHFQSPDVRATAQRVRDGGGTVRTEPMDVMGEGVLAQFTDPQGAQFACWQPGKTGGLDVAGAENSLVWVELHVPDQQAGIDFYASLFGWRHSGMPMPGMLYQVLSVADGAQDQGSFGGVAPQGGADDWAGAAAGETSRWVPYFHVGDVDATAGRIQDGGGSVLVPPADLPAVGRIAWAADPAGAVFALLKPNPRT